MHSEYYFQIAPATIRGLIEIIVALLMFIGLIAVVWHRIKQDRGITSLSIQFMSVIFVFSTVLILSLEGVLKGETVSTLIGTLAGYIFSEFGKRPSVQNQKPTVVNPPQEKPQVKTE